MDLMGLQNKLDAYSARDKELAARQEAATTDRQRFELERMRRLVQLAISGLLDQAKRDVSRDRDRETERGAVRSQTAA